MDLFHLDIISNEELEASPVLKGTVWDIRQITFDTSRLDRETPMSLFDAM